MAIRSRIRRFLIVGMGLSISKAIESLVGWLAYWPLQETSGSVAAATNVAVALGRNIALLTYADYTAGAGWSNSGGQVALHTAGDTADLSLDGVVAAGTTWQLTYTVSGRTAGSVTASVGGDAGTARSTNAQFVETFTSTGTDVDFTPTSDFDGSIDVSLTLLKQTDIAASTAFPGAELLITANDGVMDKDNWNAISSAVETNYTEAGELILRIGYGGEVSPSTLQSNRWAKGQRVSITGFARSDGTGVPRFVDGFGAIWTGTTSTAWQEFDFEHTATTLQTKLQTVSVSNPGEYAEFRNVSVKPVNPLNGDIVGGVTLGTAGNSKMKMMSFDGATGYIDIYSAELNSIVDFGGAGTIIVAGRSNTWAAGIDMMVRLAADANNEIYISRNGTDLIASYDAGGTAETITIPSLSPTSIFSVAITWDTSGGGEVKAYYNGTQSGTTQTIAGTWVGNLGSTLTCIGANSTTPTNVWDGDLSHTPVIATRALTQPEITSVLRSMGII